MHSCDVSQKPCNGVDAVLPVLPMSMSRSCSCSVRVATDLPPELQSIFLHHEPQVLPMNTKGSTATATAAAAAASNGTATRHEEKETIVRKERKLKRSKKTRPDVPDTAVLESGFAYRPHHAQPLKKVSLICCSMIVTRCVMCVCVCCVLHVRPMSHVHIACVISTVRGIYLSWTGTSRVLHAIPPGLGPMMTVMPLLPSHLHPHHMHMLRATAHQSIHNSHGCNGRYHICISPNRINRELTWRSSRHIA